ncbi:MAG: hypothetical protein ACFFD8_06355 [Candidatus Thorarchaeota archaeon]
MMKLDDSDDYLHQVTNHSNWRESWYFNWVDSKANICGFSTIGLLPNQSKREFVFALFIDGNPEFYFSEPTEPVPNDVFKALDDGTLTYKLVKPFADWHINYRSPRLVAEVQWKSRFPACDFGSGSRTSWVRHLEQSGNVTGHIQRLDEPPQYFQGYGQRDKSWGVRNWHIDAWFALHAQFDEIMIGLRYDVVKGKGHLSGCISSNHDCVALKEIRVETEFVENTIRKPVKALTHLRDKKNRTYTLHSEILHPMTFARYARPFEGGETELFEVMVKHTCEELGKAGTGLAEWLFTHQ